MVQAAKMAAKALLSLKELMKAGETESAADKAADGGEDNEPVDDDELDLEDAEFLDKFLSTNVDLGLDDHADVMRNPVLMYQVKRAKDVARRDKRRQSLVAEGMDEDDVERLLLDEAAGVSGGGGGDGQKQNALALLIAHGARVKPMDGAGGADAQAADERRRAARTVEVYLQKDLGIEVKRTYREKAKSKNGPLDVALKTKDEPYGGSSKKRNADAAKTAKRMRVHFRLIHKDRAKRGLEYVPSNVEEYRRGAQQVSVSAKDQAALSLEVKEGDFAAEGEGGGEEEDEDDGEEGSEEGSEEEEEEEELAA